MIEEWLMQFMIKDALWNYKPFPFGMSIDNGKSPDEMIITIKIDGRESDFSLRIIRLPKRGQL